MVHLVLNNEEEVCDSKWTKLWLVKMKTLEILQHKAEMDIDDQNPTYHCTLLLEMATLKLWKNFQRLMLEQMIKSINVSFCFWSRICRLCEITSVETFKIVYLTHVRCFHSQTALHKAANCGKMAIVKNFLKMNPL